MCRIGHSELGSTDVGLSRLRKVQAFRPWCMSMVGLTPTQAGPVLNLSLETRLVLYALSPNSLTINPLRLALLA